MIKIGTLLLSGIFFWGTTLTAADRVTAGTIIDFYGGAFAANSEGTRNLSKSSPIYSGDEITTGKNTRLKLEMQDGTTLVLGDQTEFQIQDFQRQSPFSPGNVAFRFLKGFFHNVSGAIAHKDPSRFKMWMPVAVIGVKGTEFWGGFWDNGKYEIALLKGTGIVIENKGGKVEITSVGWGTTITAEDIAPSEPKLWGEDKIKRAVATVTWKAQP